MDRSRLGNIWIIVQQRGGALEPVTFGLIAEARRLLSGPGRDGAVVAVALGSGLAPDLEKLGAYGATKVLYVEDKTLIHYQGELFTKTLFNLAETHHPDMILTAHTPEMADLCPRLAALLDTTLVTRAADLRIDPDGRPFVVRPVSNGHLFEEIHFDHPGPIIVSFLPSVLSTPDPEAGKPVEIFLAALDVSPDHLKTRTVRIIDAAPQDLDLEEAEIIVSGGRGVGRGKSFEIVHELAGLLGGSVAGTRPVIDWQTLPFDRQIGQTGKTVAPRLIFACGISGANEFTAGMERAQLVVAINRDPRARIFRFADLGVVGDVHEVLPLLIERLRARSKMT